MALEPCRECGQQVSTEATTWPQCGVPDPTSEEEEYDWDWIDYTPETSPKSLGGKSRPSGSIILENPANGYRKRIDNAGIKTFFTGSLYFLHHGMLASALLGMLAGFLTVGIAWLYIAYKAEHYIIDHYQSRGWKLVKR